MNVLLSVKPHFAESIFNGKKKYEYRKTRFSISNIQKIIVYASSPIKKIVGEFHIAEIIQDTPELIWLRTGNLAGIRREIFFHYFTGKNIGYAIRIKHAKKYRVPYDPRDVVEGFIPPQSFMYINTSAVTPNQAEGKNIGELNPKRLEELPSLEPTTSIAF